MATVELDIFSGRPNPIWTLDSYQRDELIDQLRAGTITLLAPDITEGKLGYRGMIVTLDRTELAILGRSDGRYRRFRIRSGLAVDADVNSIAETWLLESRPTGFISDEVGETATRAVTGPINTKTVDIEGIAAVAAVAACTIYSTSSTSFTFWNGTTADRQNNNCYNYASNWRTGTFAQPGRRSGTMFSSLTLSNISDACKRDGWSTSCNGSSIVFSLWIWPNTDYHFYRKTADVGGQSRWCHKPGSTNARNYDSSGKIITAPAQCDRGSYNTGAVVLYHPAASATVS